MPAIHGSNSILLAIERRWACLIASFCTHFSRIAPPGRPFGGHGRAPGGPKGGPHDFGRPLGAQEGSMTAPDGLGEAPAGRPGRCKMLFFSIVFYNVFTFPMHLALWLMLFARDAKWEGQR